MSKNSGTRLGHFNINGKFISSFTYTDSEEFIRKLTDITNKFTDDEYNDKKFTVDFYGNKDCKHQHFVLHFYGVLELLLFVNGMQTVEFI